MLTRLHESAHPTRSLARSLAPFAVMMSKSTKPYMQQLFPPPKKKKKKKGGKPKLRTLAGKFCKSLAELASTLGATNPRCGCGHEGSFTREIAY